MKIVSVILNWNGEKLLPACLHSLVENRPDKVDTNIIVIDNASADGSADLVRTKYPGVSLITLNRYTGISEAKNIGIQAALKSGADFIWLSASNVVIQPDFFAQMLISANHYRDGLVFVPKIYSAAPAREKIIYSAGGSMNWTSLEYTSRGSGETDTGQYDRDLEVDYSPATNSFIRVKAFSEAGLFDPRYFILFDDADFCVRVRRRAYRIIYIFMAVATVYPESNPLDGPAGKYYHTRNRLFFGLQKGSFSTKISLIPQAVNIYFHGEPWERRAVLDVFTGNMGPGSYQWE